MPPKRRKRFQGLYYHSSPPKVMPMNGKEGSQNGRKRRDGDDFSVKLSTIRIWMHEKDVGKLTRILWAGQGNRLCQQASNNGRMKRFLAAVPHVMNAIKDVHQAVIDNNLETLQAKLEPPVPPAMVTCKDANGLNIIHKAAGLGHTKILEYIIGIWPEGAHETDITGKTPLHWAASAKNNMRCYTLLTQAGCDEEALDYKMKSPSYYRHKPHEIERAFLVYVPEAPRVSPDIMTDWEALSAENENGTESKKLDIKLPEANGINGRSVEDSIENTSELDLNDGVSANEEDDELCKDELSQNLENGKNSPKKTATPPEPEATNEVNDEDETNKTEDKQHEKNDEPQDEKNRTNDLNEDEVNKNGDDDGDDNIINEENKEHIDKTEKGDDHEAEEVTIKQDETNGNDEKEYENEEFETEVEVEAEGEGEDIKANNNENKEIKENENDDENGNANDDENGNANDENENGNENDENGDKELPKEIEKENIKLSPAASNEQIDKTEDDNDAKEDDNVDEIMVTKQIKGNKQLIQDQETGEKMCIKKDTATEIESENEIITSKDVNENHIKDIEEKNNIDDGKHDKADEDDCDGDGEDDDEDVIENVTNTINNNNNGDKYMNNDDASSPTSSLAIEGFVQGESEDNTVQSQTAAYNDHDDDDQDDNNDEESHIKRIIKNGDMEQLAEIVLNGDGNKLLDMKSQEPEIQAFLNNVPTYMSKIRRVHDAARDGSLLSLQQALDRRKFAVAKDEISPNGATPLHVAVLFGNSDIVRYLAARFPETMNSIDNNGRTALHYAATIKDNGHFYNILTQLGSNTKSLDTFGHTPEFILNGSDPTSKTKTDDLLNYKQLLREFGAEELETQLLNDQGQVEHQSFQSNPIFKTEQGKYLADSLADPLIKALTEIANRRPEDPIAYLTGYLQNYMHTRKSKTEAIIHSDSSNTSSTALANSNPSTTRKGKNSNSDSNFDNIEVDEQSNDDDDAAQAQHLEERDEHGQSMLHFACARSHRRGGLFTLIEESRADITYRDELYRTARDVALQANQTGNAKEIDRYVLTWAVSGDVKEFEFLALQGYDHILDVIDDSGKSISDIVAEHGHDNLTDFLHNLRSLEESREEFHQMIRDNNVTRIQEIVNGTDGKWHIKTKNYYGRTALHIAILKESTELTELFVSICPEALKITDNLERTVLHYAMGTNAIETLSRILIQNGAKRTAKDLKGRQPTYYFMNKADILRLQEEEEENR